MSRSNAWLPGLALVLLTFLVYLPIWRAGFIWDDDSFLTSNAVIHDARGLYYFWFTASTPDYFPLTSTTLWLEWRLWGMNPLGYHLVNVLLHSLSAVLWWRVLFRLKLPGAWLAAAIFAVHPVNVESVAWITERKNTLAMFFFAFTLMSFLKAERTGRTGWYWLSIGSFLLGLLSKTSVAPLPLVLLGVAWWQRGKLTRRDVVRSVPFFILALALGLVTMWFQSHRAIGDDVIRNDGIASRLAVAGCAVWFYLAKGVLPINLSFVYPRWQLNPAAVLSYLPLLLLLAAFWLCWRYRRSWGRSGLAGLGYYVLMLLPVLGFVNIYFMKFSFVADHWQYFALIAVAAAVAAGLEFGLRGWSNGARTGAATGLLLLLAILAWRQIGVFTDEETLWRRTLAQNPKAFLALNNLGAQLLLRNETDQASELFRKALEQSPEFAEAHYNLGNALLDQGHLDSAIAEYERAVACRPKYADPYNNLGSALVRAGRTNEAINSFEKAIEIQPRFASAHSSLGCLLFEQNKASGIAHLRRAVEIEPTFAEAHYNLGNTLLKMGSSAEALQSFQRAIEIKPDYPAAHNNLGSLLFQLGRTNEAIRHFQKALETDPGYNAAHDNLAQAYLQENNLSAAAMQLEKSLETRPKDATAHNNLGILLVRLARLDAAELHFRKAIELQPDYALAYQNLGGVLLDNRRLRDSAEYSQRALALQPTLFPAVENLHDTARLLASDPDDSVRDGAKALEVARLLERVTATNNPAVIGTLAAAYAETGRYAEARTEAERALSLATAQTNSQLIKDLQIQLALYRAGRPYRAITNADRKIILPAQH